ncbi:hypothetical protein ACFLWA_04195 [Chloroflexota bacterium]
MNRWTRTGDIVVLCLLACAALALGLLLNPLAVDDAFVTFRYAQNLASGQGFTYNPGRPILSTTAPLFALVLAGGAVFWSNLPAMANTLSALAIWVAAVLVFVLGRREGTPWIGAVASLLLVVHPLLWLSLGLETSVFLALALGAIVAYRGGHSYGTAALLALATLTRGDGLILAAVIAADSAFRYLSRWFRGEKATSELARDSQDSHIPRALTAAGVFFLVLLPLALWLTWQFGSPIPATLRAKVSQAELGVTGFYAHTSYLQGLAILLRARLAQSPLYLLFIPAAVAGLVGMWRRGAWVRLVVAWGAAQLVGYTLLGVTPYYWYYAPLVPALVSTAALGVAESVIWLARQGAFRQGVGRIASVGLGVLWAAALMLALLRSDWAVVQALDGAVPPPEELVSKVLPEAKGRAYRQTGEWLAENTPPDATVGVTEVGVMGYYAERPMVDFLGLLEPEVSEALARGDLYWALLHYQPEYLALTAVSPLYAYDLRADPWFQTAYTPVETVDDPRFWGSPVTIYWRTADRTPLTDAAPGELPEDAIRLDIDFGGQIRLLGAVSDRTAVHPGEVLPLTLYWQAVGPVERDYLVFVHLLGEHERVIAQRDASPGLGARPTSGWAPNQIVVDPHLVALPGPAYTPDEAVWEVGLYDAETGRRLPRVDGGDQARFGTAAVRAGATPLHLDFGSLALTGYELDRRALTPGDTLRLTLRWNRGKEDSAPVLVTVRLVSEAGEVETEVSRLLERAQLDADPYELAIEVGAPPGAYDLEVLLVDGDTGTSLPLLGADNLPRGAGARLTKVRLYP